MKNNGFALIKQAVPAGFGCEFLVGMGKEV